MKNKPVVIIRFATAVCVAVLFLLNFSNKAFGVVPGAGSSCGNSGSYNAYEASLIGECSCIYIPEGCGGGGGGGGGYQPPPDIWDQDPPDADGVYTGHPPDKDGLVQPGDLVPDLCEWIYGYHCASVGRDYTLKQDWTEDPQSGELYDPYTHNAPGQVRQKEINVLSE